MPTTTGRAVSAAIHSRLREALVCGDPLSYSQLAERAGCTVRSVRNYLARSEEIFGFPVERLRDGRHNVLVRALGVTTTVVEAPAVAEPSHQLGREFIDALFTSIAATSGSSPSRSFRICLRGIPRYDPHHRNGLERWLEACDARPLRPVRIAANPDRDAPELVLWPVAAVFHNIEGLVLVGVPLAAVSVETMTTLPLAMLADTEGSVQPIGEAGEPPFAPDDLDLEKLLDLPFALDAASAGGKKRVHVHVRFTAEVAMAMKGRVWHPTQRTVLRRDGSLDVTFGPVKLDAAASWAASLGQSAEILGDKRLRKAVKKRSFLP